MKRMLPHRKEYVLMDTEGPGAIVRFWMTSAGQDSGKGTLRIYFDEEETPTIEGTAYEIISGDKLTGEPLSASVSDLSDYERRESKHRLFIISSIRSKNTWMR